jgi:hypothetical protein
MGLPDVVFSEFLVEETEIEHGGVFGDAVTAVDSTGKILTLNGGGWGAVQWDSYVLSLYYRPGAATQPGLNIKVTANTTGTPGTLTMAAAGFLVGDVVVMRAKASIFGPNTIGDANYINSYAPDGLDIGEDVGNMILLIYGTGAGTTPKSISANSETGFTIQGNFDITPDATTGWIVVSPTVAYAYYTNSFTNGVGAAASPIATTPAMISTYQQLWVTVFACDVNGNASPTSYQPSREVYVPPNTMLSTALVLTVQGTLAIGSDLAPLFYPMNAIAPAAVVARVKTPPTGAALTIQIYSGSTLWLTLAIADGTNSIQATATQLTTAGPLPAAADVILNVTGVGTTVPGADLSVMVFT